MTTSSCFARTFKERQGCVLCDVCRAACRATCSLRVPVAAQAHPAHPARVGGRGTDVHAFEACSQHRVRGGGACIVPVCVCPMLTPPRAPSDVRTLAAQMGLPALVVRREFNNAITMKFESIRRRRERATMSGSMSPASLSLSQSRFRVDGVLPKPDK